jgi:signal transduction histidine kinase/CheY-like chemotaxis protein
MSEMPNETGVPVLTVDVDEAGRRAVAQVLRQAGFRVTEAVLDWGPLAADRTALILPVVHPPDRSALAVSRRFKADPDAAGSAVAFLSPVAESLTGWGQVEAAGQPLEMVFRIAPEGTRRPAQTPVKQVPGPEVSAGPANHTLLVARDGTERSIAGGAAPVRDVGPERQAEREREALLAREHAARAEAEAANHHKDQFLAVLGHELRSPLGSLRSALHVLGLEGHDAAIREQTHALAARQVSQLGRIVDELLDLSRIGQGKVELRKERVDLLDVVARAVDTARPGVEAHGHDLRVATPPEPVWLDADPGRLQQVVVNLVHNAAKYTEPGGRIDLKVEREGGRIAVRVKDTGIGMGREMLGRVFDLYTQVEGARGHAEGGLGIGLTLARGLVALHGGSIEAFSEGLGHGSEFVAWLPAEAGVRAEAGPAEPGPARHAGRKLRLLLVDDDADSLAAMALLLRLWGHGVETARDGPSALAAARAGLPEVVLLDISLPGIDGHEVCRRLRREPGLGRAFLVALTGHAHEDDRRLSSEAGFDEHLVKPVDPDVLKQLLVDYGAAAPAEAARSS